MLDADTPVSLDPAFRALRRFDLDEHSWVDLVPHWVQGGNRLFTVIEASAPWEEQRTRVMWDNVVDEPRILARWPDTGTLPAAANLIRSALADRYRTDFDLIAVNLYRSGRDSVAWHGDRVRLTHDTAVVCTVSLGDRRRFMIRPRGGGRALVSWRLGAGDLVVMGGRCQHDYEHCVPKMAYAGARMSLTFRHTGIAPSSV